MFDSFHLHVLIGSVITFVVGYSCSLLFPSHDDAHGTAN